VGCRSGQETSAIGTWYAENPLVSQVPQTLVLEKNKQGKFQYRGKLSKPLRWKWVKNNLQIKADTMQWKAYLLQKDTLILIDPQHHYTYLKKQPQITNNRKSINELLPLLDAPSVQERLVNLVNYFQNGDFLDSETLCFLIGISPKPMWGEHSEIAEQRNFIKQIRRIVKQGDLFIIETHQTPLETEIGYYTGKKTRARQGSFDVKIASSAHAQIIHQAHSIQIKLQGVKIGKGILLFDAPDLEIYENVLKILGMNLMISR